MGGLPVASLHSERGRAAPGDGGDVADARSAAGDEIFGDFAAEGFNETAAEVYQT